ncbi:MAG TPA: hypothetical protein VFG34_02695 [Sphingopyxis sp.]|nr:hypothetical protein [Sphingopyxis sp.]
MTSSVKGKMGEAVALIGSIALAASPVVAAEQNYDWVLRINQDRVSDAVLSYEIADTDAQMLMLSCEEGGQRIFVGSNHLPSGAQQLQVAAAGIGQMINGQSRYVAEVDENYFTSVSLDDALPIFGALARSDTWTMASGSKQWTLTSNPQGRTKIGEFLRFCRG